MLISFYATLLSVVHLVVRLLVLVRHWLQVAILRRPDDHLILRLIGQLQSQQRLPAHIALVMQEELRYRDLGALVVWCMAAGISVISLYDHQGSMKKNVELVSKCVASHQNRLLGKGCTDYVIKATSPYKNGSTNGYTNWVQEKTIKINVLSHNDGRRDIVNAAKTFSARNRGSPEAPRIKCEEFESLLHSNHNLPSPDLLVIFGPSYSVVGFLPWHLHLTEILHLRTHHHIKYTTFHNSLLRFASCEQRFGK